MLIDLPHRNRFFSKLKRVGDCIEWTAAKNKGGYGLFGVDRKCQLAHRVSWAIKYDQWPNTGLMHSCNNPACVNPEHLSEGSQKENIAQAVGQNRHAHGDSHPRCKVTELDRQAIAEAASMGATAHELAEKYEVTASRVYTIAGAEGVKMRYSSNPVGRPAKRYRVGNELLTIAEIADRAGMTREAITYKLRQGLTGYELLHRNPRGRRPS